MTLLEVDPNAISTGYIQTFIGFSIVFVVLIFLAVLFMGVQKIMTNQARKSIKSKGSVKKEIITDEDINISGDVNAAIGAALYMYFNEMHDEESGVITIKQIQRRYSPWSSKIYNLNNIMK